MKIVTFVLRMLNVCLGSCMEGIQEASFVPLNLAHVSDYQQAPTLCSMLHFYAFIICFIKCSVSAFLVQRHMKNHFYNIGRRLTVIQLPMMT